MFSPATRRSFSILLVVALTLTISFAQTRRKTSPPKPQAPATQPEKVPDEPQELDTLKTDTDLVSVPVIATDRNGINITDLRKEDFAVTEDGVAQEIAFFGKVAAPFHVVLVLDTSSSTKDKLRVIQEAAYAFVEQLQPADRVKVISFDDKVKDLNEFTNNREALRRAIDGTRAGDGSKVYDAVEMALSALRKIKGRRAIVMFSDGMDWHSDNATFETTLRWLDEEDVVVYPIRYETRATTERLAREQANETTPELPTIDVVRKPPSGGTTPPTFPGNDPVPTTTRRTGPFGLPLPDDVMRRRDDRMPPPTDQPGRDPDVVDSRDRRPRNLPSDRRQPIPSTGGRTDPTTEESIAGMLDLAYMKADKYLDSLAVKSGGRLLRADTIASLPDAFSKIAAELRTQYMLGYYPIKKERDERYRTIKVTTTRENVAIRARPGYLATAAK
jgi:Mg-chelatase subunit ChlD